MDNIIINGIYQHFKGNKYKVIGIARHSENLENLVVYQKLDNNKELWVRPVKIFSEEVEVDGKRVLRFKNIND